VPPIVYVTGGGGFDLLEELPPPQAAKDSDTETNSKNRIAFLADFMIVVLIAARFVSS
jgi:hypothetical protein